jgi:hypothetical protein
MNRSHRTAHWIALAVAAAALAAATAVPAADDYGNYALVRGIDGSGTLQPAGDGQPQSLVKNLPITPGDTVSTDAGGRVDLLLQDGNHLILDTSSRIEIDRLPAAEGDKDALSVRLWKGAMFLDMRVWNAPMSGYLVSTPSAMLSPAKGGLYLVQVDSVDRTLTACLEGSCAVVSAGESVNLNARQSTYAEYGYPPMTPRALESVPSALMAFRNENIPRPRPESTSSQYLPENLSAWASDLDDNGSWAYDNSYGYVWHPTTVVEDWAPYTYGQWDYNPWGMTWVPYETWGWAPCHYGRWVWGAGYGWGWCPMAAFAPAWCSFWWGDGGWLGWCPMDYWGAPLWGPCGWNSCSIGNIYNTNVNNYITHHRDAPPPQPVYPRAQGTPGSLRGSGPRGGAGGINLSPGTVRAYRDGQISAGEVRTRLTEPVAMNRRNYPPIQPSDRTRAGSGGGGVLTRGGGTGQVGVPRDRGGLSSGSGQGGAPRDGSGSSSGSGQTGVPRDRGGVSSGTGQVGVPRDRGGLSSGSGQAGVPRDLGGVATEPRHPIEPVPSRRSAPAAPGLPTLFPSDSSGSSTRHPTEPRAPGGQPSRAPRGDSSVIPGLHFSDSGGSSRREPLPDTYSPSTPRQPIQYGDRDGRAPGSTYTPQRPQGSYGSQSPRNGSAPSYGGSTSRSAPPSSPRYIPSRPSAPSGGGGGHYSPPSGGGGGHYSPPSGGGGGHSAPSGGGGSHSAPSGGGHRR